MTFQQLVQRSPTNTKGLRRQDTISLMTRKRIDYDLTLVPHHQLAKRRHQPLFSSSAGIATAETSEAGASEATLAARHFIPSASKATVPT
jgi:hypothetical protein